jgi:hypothetical protein
MMQGLGIKEQGLGVAMLVSLMMGSLVTPAQEIRLDGVSPVKKPHLVLLTDGVDVKAGAEQTVELRFRVDAGYHINSHSPMDDLLIPTTLKFVPGMVKVAGTEYPQGEIIKLTGSGEGLDVYQGDFKVLVKLVAPRGFSTMTGTVRYQACDSASCFPPKTLAVRLAVTAK